jgi:hypothetical protein
VKEMNMDMRNKAVFSSDGMKKGVVLGETLRSCFEGCRGPRLSVKWEDGRVTFPCVAGMVELFDGSLKIGR